MSDDATYEANTVDELKAEIDRRPHLSRTGLSHKDELIKVLTKDDKSTAKSGDKSTAASADTSSPAPPASDSDLVPTEAGRPEKLHGEDVVEAERSDTQGVALGDIPLLDPRDTVGSAPKIPEGFQAATASARSARIEALATELGEHGIEEVKEALAARNKLADANGGEVLVEASGPVSSPIKGGPDDEPADSDANSDDD